MTSMMTAPTATHPAVGVRVREAHRPERSWKVENSYLRERMGATKEGHGGK